MTIRKDKTGLDAVLTVTDIDIAWAAGVYEGEGSCVKSGHTGKSFSVSVAQKDPELLYRLRDLFGGSVKEYDNDRGTIANGRKAFKIFAWRVCGDRARIFLASIYQHLTARRKAQIDSTSASVFLSYASPLPKRAESVPSASFAEMKQKLNEYIIENLEKRLNDRNNFLKKYHSERKSDERYMEKRRANTREWRRKRKGTQDSGNIISIA